MTNKPEHTADDIAVLEPVETTTSTISIIIPEPIAAVDVDELLEVDLAVENQFPPVPASRHILMQESNQLVTRPRTYENRFLPIVAAIVATFTFGVGLVAIGVLIGQGL